LNASSPLPEARYVSFGAADFKIGLPLEEAMSPGALLASRLNGQPLAPEHGGPCRLVIVGKECFYSIKWVDNIEVTATRPTDTAKEIALKRIG
jgi:DMSO/TMAO reductase YedYZ molybdopterin-dependent catalytic subunit